MAHFQSASLAIVIRAGLIAASASPLVARGGSHHLFGTHMAGHGMRDTAFSGVGRRRDSAYIKAASDERDKLLGKLKNICRGC